jgi:hypothetical protein
MHDVRLLESAHFSSSCSIAGLGNLDRKSAPALSVLGLVTSKEVET